MRRQSVNVLRAMLLMAVTSFVVHPVSAQVLALGERLIDLVEVTDHDDQADVVVAFNCALRYQSHLPTTEGSELRIQLVPQADCGIRPGTPLSGEFPAVSGGENLLEAARVEADVPGQATLVLRWRKAERFVLVQGANLRSMRIRLLDRARGRGKIMLNDVPDVETLYALNLESQPRQFDPPALERAQQLLHLPSYQAQAVVEGVTWYRLRVGPIAQRAKAEDLLKQALQEYPRAWLAIGDDATGSALPADTSDMTLPAVGKMGSDPLLPEAQRKALLADARKALGKRDYATAITALTQLQRQPEFAQRADAQEMLGLARERAGQLAHAKAEYEEYLRRYPQGGAAGRIRLRLRILREASLKESTGGGGVSADQGWKLTGGFAQMYRYDGSKVDSTTTANADSQTNSTQKSATNGLMTDVDLLARRRGESVDFAVRLSAGYTRNFAAGNSGAGNSNDVASITRVSIASVEMAARQLGILARLGRQARNSGGVLGSFDGAFLSWNWVPAWGVQLTAGYPVELTNQALQRQRRFTSLGLAYTPPGAHWDASAYLVNQQFEGLKDRQAVGTELRYLGSQGSLVALLDYDTFFKSLNTVALLGTWQLPARWSLSFDAEKRNSPVLTTRNALIGQPVNSIAEMRQVFFPDEIHQFALDRTPSTTQYSLTLTRPLADRFQFSTSVAASSTADTPESGGVAAQPGTGTNLSYQMQLYGSNIFLTGDFNVLSVNYASTEVGKLSAVGLVMRFPVNGAWRLGPRLTVNHRTLTTTDSSENTLILAALLDYLRGRNQFQFEAGGQLGKLDGTDQTQKSTRYYGSIAYRLGF